MNIKNLFKKREQRSIMNSGAWVDMGENRLPSFVPGAVTPETAEALSTVFACVTAISSSISALPARLYQTNGKTRQEVTTGQIAALLRNGPNAYQSTPEFLETLTAQILLRGNGLVEVTSDKYGTVIGLRVIPWNWVNVQMLPNGRLVYDVFAQPGLYTPENGRARRLLQDEVIHIRDRSDDGVIGKSRLQRGAATIHSAHTVNEYATTTFHNGVNPSGVISTDAQLTPEQKTALQSGITRAFAGAKGAGKVLVIDQGLQWNGNAVTSPEDTELLASRKWSVEELCRLFQVPPPIIQDYSHNTFTNSEQAGRWFAQFCLLPLVSKIEAAFNRGLFPGGEYELDLDMSGFDRGDPATRWQTHAIAAQNGILTVDEIREVEGYSPMVGETIKKPLKHTENIE